MMKHLARSIGAIKRLGCTRFVFRVVVGHAMGLPFVWFECRRELMTWAEARRLRLSWPAHVALALAGGVIGLWLAGMAVR